MWAREPGQVRKEAALSGSRRCRRQAWLELAGGGHARRPRFEGGAHGPLTRSLAARVERPGAIFSDQPEAGGRLGADPAWLPGVEQEVVHHELVYRVQEVAAAGPTQLAGADDPGRSHT